jgi:hypothetical protein
VKEKVKEGNKEIKNGDQKSKTTRRQEGKGETKKRLERGEKTARIRKNEK